VPARKRPSSRQLALHTIPHLLPMNAVQQVRIALRPRNRLATLLGFTLGGFVPLASFFVAHYELTAATHLYMQPSLYLVLGGLAYSAKTVWQWGKIAFQNAFKAAGFVVLLEGVMVSSHIAWLSIAALVYLMGINGVATGCNLTTGASESGRTRVA
jgi:VIT1/CCC1 family predicted Fe2+/Mn2+ transporter